MAGPFPAELLPPERVADAAQRDLRPVEVCEVLDQQACRPDGRAVAVLARVLFYDFRDERLDDAAGGARPPLPLAVG